MIAEINELITKIFEYFLLMKYKTKAIARFIIITTGTTIIIAIEILGFGSFSFTQNQITIKSIIVNNSILINNFIFLLQ